MNHKWLILNIPPPKVFSRNYPDNKGPEDEVGPDAPNAPDFANRQSPIANRQPPTANRKS